MRSPAELGKSFICAGLWVRSVGIAPAASWGQIFQVTMEYQQMYSEASFTSIPVGPVPRGAQVTVVEQAADWCKVEYEGKQGWMHRTAVRQAGPPQLMRPGGLGPGAPVRETRSDEVALAGKGFNPEVEAGYRQKHPEMKYALVDEVEGFQVDENQFQAFIREGGLTP